MVLHQNLLQALPLLPNLKLTELYELTMDGLQRLFLKGKTYPAASAELLGDAAETVRSREPKCNKSHRFG